MEKDYITINTDDGNTLQAELVSKFELTGLGEYVIYKVDDEFYGAKYEVDGDKTNLITDLTEQEEEALNEIFSHLEVA